MSSDVKIAVFGCGYWGKNHVRTLHEIGALACVVDADPDAAQSLAAQYDVPARDAQSVFADPEIQAIVMALPAQHHARTAIDAFAAGKHVFSEKPIALHPRDAEPMVAAAAKADRILMAGHILCYHNAFRAVMKLVDEGALGTIKYVQSHRLGFGKFHEKFDAIWDLAPHDLSLLLSVTRCAPTQINALPVSISGGQNDFAHVALDFGSDLKGHINISRFSPYVERRFTIIGTKAMVVWDDTQTDWAKKVSIHAYQKDEAAKFVKSEPEYVPCEQGMALTDELNHFIDCIRKGKKPLTDGQQGLDVVRILSAVA